MLYRDADMRIKMQSYLIDADIRIKIQFYVPSSVSGEVTLMLNIEKNTMKYNSDKDMMFYGVCGSNCYGYKKSEIDADITHWRKNITASSSGEFYYIELDRKVLADKVRNVDLDLMPGFTLTWKYKEMIEPNPKFSNDGKTKLFVR